MALTPPTTTVDVAQLATKASADAALAQVTTWIDEDRAAAAEALAVISAHTASLTAHTAQMATLQQTLDNMRRKLRIRGAL